MRIIIAFSEFLVWGCLFCFKIVILRIKINRTKASNIVFEKWFVGLSWRVSQNPLPFEIIKNEVKGIIGNIDVSILLDTNLAVKNSSEYSVISEYNKYKNDS